MIWKRILKGFLIVLLMLISAVPVYEFSSPFFRPFPRHFHRVTVVSVDLEGGKHNWLTMLHFQASDGTTSRTLIPTTDALTLNQGSSILLMTGEWDLKRKYEHKVTFTRLLLAYHSYILLLAPLCLLFIISRSIVVRLRA